MKSHNKKDLKHLIKFTTGRNLKTYPYNILYHDVAKILDGSWINYFSTFIPETSSDTADPFYGYGCFRARLVNNYTDVEFEKNIWAPPAHLNKNFGRCSEPDQQKILYCSNSMVVALAELGAKENQTFVMASFAADRFEENENLFIVPVGTSRDFFEKSTKFNPNGYELKKNLSRKMYQKQLIVDQFVNRCFQKRVYHEHTYKYKLTAAISKFYLEESKDKALQIAGIMYPSVKASLKSFNMAFYEDLAKKFLEVVWIRALKISKIEGNHYQFKYIAYATEPAPGEALHWIKVGS